MTKGMDCPYVFDFQAIEERLPISRKELLSQVVTVKRYGSIKAVWHKHGHVFITTDGGRNLFTFDCIPVHPQNFFSNSSLDIYDCASPVIRVLLISPSLTAVVESSGRVQWWHYSSYDWMNTSNMGLCSLSHSTVESAAFLPASQTLLWCEGNRTKTNDNDNSAGYIELSEQSSWSFSIKSQNLTISDSSGQEREGEATRTLVENLPPCDLFVVGSDRLIIQTKPDKDQISVTLVCNSDLAPTTLFIGTDKFEIKPSSSTSQSTLDFRSLMLNYLPNVIKMELTFGDLGAKHYGNRLVTLSSSGVVEVFTNNQGKKEVGHHVFSVGLEDCKIQPGFWFIHKNFLGIIYNKAICLYSMLDGSCVCKWNSDQMEEISQVIPSSSPAFLALALSTKGLLTIQATDMKSKMAYSSAETLPNDELLETAILQLAHLHQLKQQAYNKKVSDSLDKLKQSWADGKGTQQCQIVQMASPILDEYWKLDRLAKTTLDKDQRFEEHSKESRFEEEFLKSTSLPRQSRDSRLLWLSQVYPHQLLQTLTKAIDLDCEEVPESEFADWQKLLGIDGWDLYSFEQVCRLLFQHHPHKLHHFVKCAESVSEQTVGVDAFIRKKHSMIFYRSALECLPPAETSCNPQIAATVQGKLMLAGGGQHAVTDTLKHLLHNKLWSEAVNLVKTQTSDQHRLPSYLYNTVEALAQNQQLHEFVPELLSLMPSWRSLHSFGQVLSKQEDINQRQKSMMAKELFCADESKEIQLGTVMELLLRLIPK